MVRVGVSLGEDDTLHSCIDLETMEKSSTCVPFKGSQEMHVSTIEGSDWPIQPYRLLCRQHEFIQWYVWITCVFKLKSYFVLSKDSNISCPNCFARNHIWACLSIGCDLFVLESNYHVYEKVVKPFLKQAKHQVEPSLTPREPPNSLTNKRA